MILGDVGDEAHAMNQIKLYKKWYLKINVH